MAGPFTPEGPPDAFVPREYHQLLRGPGYRWWRPAASLLLVLSGAFVLYVTWSMVILGLARMSPVVRSAAADGAHADAYNLLTTNVILASAIPLTMVATWAAHGWQPRWLASVTGRLRWRWLGLCAAVCLPVHVGGAGLLSALSGGAPSGTGTDVLLLLSVVLLTTPLQAAGEEFLFRGWLTQNVGALIRHPVVSLVTGTVVSSGLFALAHGQQNGWLILDRFAFGVVACLLVWRTGGLEASIVLHALNNVVVFVPVILTGQVHETLTVSEASGPLVAMDLVMLGVIGAILMLLARRTQQERLLIPPVRWQPHP